MSYKRVWTLTVAGFIKVMSPQVAVVLEADSIGGQNHHLLRGCALGVVLLCFHPSPIKKLAWMGNVWLGAKKFSTVHISSVNFTFISQYGGKKNYDRN